MTLTDIWTANKFIKEPAGDRGFPRIPMLKSKDDQGNEILINNNEDKVRLFAKTFFSLVPAAATNYNQHEYPEPLLNPPQITVDQISRIIAKLSPYKAQGSDRILNIVLQKCTELIIN